MVRYILKSTSREKSSIIKITLGKKIPSGRGTLASEMWPLRKHNAASSLQHRTDGCCSGLSTRGSTWLGLCSEVLLYENMYRSFKHGCVRCSQHERMRIERCSEIHTPGHRDPYCGCGGQNPALHLHCFLLKVSIEHFQ